MLAKIFILIVRLSPGFQKAMWKWWYQRLARRGHNTGWSFMNYGYTPSNGTHLELKKEDESNRLFIQLYDYTASQIPIRGKHILEIGSGRGGGASFVAQYHNPSHMTGLDYSATAVKLSINLHKEVTNLQFVKGDAESLPFDDKSFDAVINVESSHCYGDMAVFVKEAARVLKPSGYLSWVDLRGEDMVSDTESAFNIPELNCIYEETITPQVLQALDDIHERKIELIDLHVPKFLQPAFRDFSGVRNSKIYNAFKDGSAVYLAKAYQKIST
mgnify:FL=1